MHTSLVHRELPVYHHMARHMTESSHRGRGNIRSLLDSFQATGPHGKHIVLVFEPAQMSISDMRLAFQLEFDESFVKAAIVELLEALDFLHTYGEVVHTGIIFYLRYTDLFNWLLIYNRRASWKHASRAKN